MSDDVTDEIRALAFQALRDRLGSATEAETARAEGIKIGAQMASEAAQERSSAEVWDKVLARAEGMLDKFLDRMEATELRKVAAATPAPQLGADAAEDKAEGDQVDAAAVLSAIAKRPPAAEAAALLASAGVTAESFPEVLAHVRGAGAGWPEFLDEQPAWVDAVAGELAREPEPEPEGEGE